MASVPVSQSKGGMASHASDEGVTSVNLSPSDEENKYEKDINANQTLFSNPIFFQLNPARDIEAQLHKTALNCITLSLWLL